MKTIKIADTTLRDSVRNSEITISFKEKLDIARELDRLGADIIETIPITNAKPDSLLIKTIASIANNSVVSCPVSFETESVETAWAAVKSAKKPRLLVSVPVSAVQMEYICHLKGPQVVEKIGELVKACHELCDDVEFAAEDATRAEPEILHMAIKAAIAAGAKTVTICDSAGYMLPNEFASFVSELRVALPELINISLAAECADTLGMAAACSFAAINAGVCQIKTTVCGKNAPSIEEVANILRSRGDDQGIKCGLNMTSINRAVRRLRFITDTERSATSAFDNSISVDIGDGVELDESADIDTVGRELLRLGYDLAPDELSTVFEAVRQAAAKKSVAPKELDAIVASTVLQVPPVYKIVSYVINCGSAINASAQVRLEKDGEVFAGLMNGDGPIDAAFLAIEQIAKRHFELEDFQIQAVTRGREAMGSAVIKLRNVGKLYSGHGVSADIIGAAIMAYVDALNKIVYEESTEI